MTNLLNVNIDTSSVDAEVAQKVKDVFEGLKEISGKHTDAITSAKGFTYKLVSSMVTVAELYDTDEQFARAVNAFATEHGIPVPNPEKGVNPYLHIVRMADMEKEKRTKPLADGSTHYWKPNRSNEKHAAAVRFFRENNIRGTEVRALLEGKEEITLLNGGKIKPTLDEVMRADRAQYAKARKPVTVTSKESEALDALVPLAAAEVKPQFKGLIQANKEGFAAVLVRFHNGQLEVLGDAGLDGDAITRRVKESLMTFQTERSRAVQTAEREVQPDAAKEEVSA